jgi:hypothetical protein
MGGMNTSPAGPLPLGMTARLLRVPAAWLRAEAEAGRIPHLKAGRVFLFDPETVERVLLERARQLPPQGKEVDRATA